MAQPPYQVRTPRLLLRCYELSDVPARLEAAESSGKHLEGFAPVAVPGGPSSLDLHLNLVRQFRGRFDLDQDRVYAVLDLTSGTFVGEACMLSRAGISAWELGYWLRRDATGQGYATEMAAALLKVAFELDRVQRADLMINPNNVASVGVATRLGFTLEGRLRSRQLAAYHTRGDLLSYTLLASEWPDSPGKKVELHASDALGRRLL